MKKGKLKSVVAMLCVAAIGVVPVFANVVAKNQTTTSTTNSNSVTYALGDVNKSGKVDLKDTVIVLRAALNIDQLDEEQTALADIVKDNKINLKDASASLKMALNIPLN